MPFPMSWEIRSQNMTGWWARATPLKNMNVSWDDYSQYLWENKEWQPNHQPVIIIITIYRHISYLIFLSQILSKPPTRWQMGVTPLGSFADLNGKWCNWHNCQETGDDPGICFRWCWDRYLTRNVLFFLHNCGVSAPILCWARWV